MLAVLTLFLLPVGGGIPAGVLLGQARGQSWPLTAGLYLVSDLLLALAFEPVLRLLVWWAAKRPALARLGRAMTEAMALTAARFGGGTGPGALILIAFGADPMTGRAAAMAAGHGVFMGWVFALAGDMLYYAVVAATTLRLNATFHHPVATVMLVFGAMLLLPALLRAGRSRWRRISAASAIPLNQPAPSKAERAKGLGARQGAPKG